MKLGKVIGNVVATEKDPGLNSLRLLVVQGIDDNLKPTGDPYVAADGILTAGPGDLVYIVSKKEAAIVFPEELVPIDECIVGYVEDYYIAKKALRKKPKRKAPPPTLEPKKEKKVPPKEPEIREKSPSEEPEIKEKTPSNNIEIVEKIPKPKPKRKTTTSRKRKTATRRRST